MAKARPVLAGYSVALVDQLEVFFEGLEAGLDLRLVLERQGQAGPGQAVLGGVGPAPGLAAGG